MVRHKQGHAAPIAARRRNRWFRNHIGTLLAGQRFDLFSYVSAMGLRQKSAPWRRAISQR